MLYLQFQCWELSCPLRAPALRVRPLSPALPGGVGGEGWVTPLLERAREQGRASPLFSRGALLGEEVAGFRCWDLPTFLVQAQLRGPFQIVALIDCPNLPCSPSF